MTKLRATIAAPLLSISLLCSVCSIRVEADSKNDAANQAKDNCTFDYYECADGCSRNNPGPGIPEGFKTCTDQCGKDLAACLAKISAAPRGTPLPKQGSPNPTATPRRGPVGVSGPPGLPKSNPTPTPRKGKGPGPVSSKPKSNPKPTPSATAPPTLLAKPKPTPHHHN